MEEIQSDHDLAKVIGEVEHYSQDRQLDPTTMPVRRRLRRKTSEDYGASKPCATGSASSASASRGMGKLVTPKRAASATIVTEASSIATATDITGSMPFPRRRLRRKTSEDFSASTPVTNAASSSSSSSITIKKAKLITPTKKAITAAGDDETRYAATAIGTTKRRIFGKWLSVQDVSPVIKRMYSDNHRHTSRLGDSATDDPMNGEFTQGSVQRLIQQMIDSTNIANDEGSVFADIGSGSGKVVLHVAATLPHLRAVGVEVSRTRYIVSLLCQKDALERADGYSNRVLFKYADILDMESLGPLTHIYLASAAFPDSLMHHLAKLWNESPAKKYLVCNHNPRQIIDTFGFHAQDMVVKVQCSMHGSGEGKTFYFYERAPDDEKVAGSLSSSTGEAVVVTADELASLGRRDIRLEAVNRVLDDFMNEPTSKRERNVKRYTA